MKPLVSILIPCYNAGPWIARCIESALAQTYPNKEIIVVDDGSTDHSLDAIRRFSEHVRFETGPNRGGNAARNRLMRLSNGEWLEFLDADDLLLPNKIEEQMALVARVTDVDVIYAPTINLFPDGSEYTAPIEDDDLYSNYFRWAFFSTTSLLLKKAGVLEVGGWKEDQHVCQEHELILRLIVAAKKFAMCRAALGVNRIQYANSVSRRSPLSTIIQRMELSDKFERFLAARGQMNELRALAVAQARFEAARSAYQWDKAIARTLMTKARQEVRVSQIKGVNRFYGWAFAIGGIDFAESIASFRRWCLKNAMWGAE